MLIFTIQISFNLIAMPEEKPMSPFHFPPLEFCYWGTNSKYLFKKILK